MENKIPVEQHTNLLLAGFLMLSAEHKQAGHASTASVRHSETNQYLISNC